MTSNLVETLRSVPMAQQDPSMSVSSTTRDVTARILKKRESDRRCQRIKRERTKSKIAALEERVRNFGSQDSTGHVQLLTKQLQDVERERDDLAKKIKTIESVIRESETNNRIPQLPASQQDRLGSDCPAPSTAVSPEHDLPESSNKSHGGEQNPHSFPVGSLDDTRHIGAVEHVPIQYTDPAVGPASALTSTTSQSFVTAPPSSVPAAEARSSSVHPLNHDRVCECCAVASSASKHPSFNTWRFANDVLSSRFTWPAYCRLLPDEHREDTPVRAITEGWEAIEACGVVHPSWAILKKIDQTLLQGCDQKERMAVIIAIQLLLLSHLKEEPVPELPTYYRKRPSQNMADSYAIHFFPWPGMRERFVFNQHRYCTNEFWNAFIKGLRLTWPYEFRDTYTRNIETGLYAVSPMFQEHVNNITCWTMDIDVFKRWPELSADIPAYNRIPRSMSNWIRKPRSSKTTLDRHGLMGHESLSKSDVIVPQRTQVAQAYSQVEHFSPAMYYDHPFSYNVGEKAISTMHWAQQIPQHSQAEIGYFVPVADPINISTRF